MAERIKASAGTSEITNGNQIEFSVHPKLFEGGRTPLIAINGLSGAETAAIWLWSSDAWLELGAGGDFTAARETDVLHAPGVYGLTKSATAGAITVSIHDQR